MMNIQIDESDAFNMLAERLNHWNLTTKEQRLYEDMYERYIDDGVFEGGEFNVMQIVDNDVVNYCRVITEGENDPEWKELLKVYKEQGIGDCSCEIGWCSYIEAVDDDDEPTAILVRS